MTDEIKLPHHLAEAVCEMESVCDSEGMGPNGEVAKELMDWIGQTYPDLKEKYNWMWCYSENRK